MPDLTRRADNPYLQGNPASAFAPEQKRDSLLDQPWMAGVAPGLEAGQTQSAPIRTGSSRSGSPRRMTRRRTVMNSSMVGE
jgi:hypothetical protein